jgi:hypothetical protein
MNDIAAAATAEEATAATAVGGYGDAMLSSANATTDEVVGHVGCTWSIAIQHCTVHEFIHDSDAIGSYKLLNNDATIMWYTGDKHCADIFQKQSSWRDSIVLMLTIKQHDCHDILIPYHFQFDDYAAALTERTPTFHTTFFKLNPTTLLITYNNRDDIHPDNYQIKFRYPTDLQQLLVHLADYRGVCVITNIHAIIDTTHSSYSAICAAM